MMFMQKKENKSLESTEVKGMDVIPPLPLFHPPPPFPPFPQHRKVFPDFVRFFQKALIIQNLFFQ